MTKPFVFEDEVRRISRARWPQARYGGAAFVDGRERDGVFETEDCVHFVEATTRRDAEKVREDTKKLFRAVVQQHKTTPYKAARGWLVTQHEPTADQRGEVANHGKSQVVILSFAQFQESIVNGPEYLSARGNHFFGSVLDPRTGSTSPEVPYIPLDLFDIGTGNPLTIRSLADELANGQQFVLLGDYGAGKSMTLRETFFSLKERYLTHKLQRFPVYLNLREHSGQDDPSEVFERHARRIGFSNPSSLVRAWRAGFLILLIDGFDELTTLGVAGLTLRLRELRRKSLGAIRKLLEQTPDDTGWVVAGREHYFDSAQERASAVGVPPTARTVSLNEFSDEQVRDYLRRATGKGVDQLPLWLPTKPLLVGSFAARGLAEALPTLVTAVDAIDGWDFLLDRICERESKISESLDGPTLRKILERLATYARTTEDGLGPLSPEIVRRAFVSVCEYEPDEQSNLLLQRLPGLGVFRVEDATRSFIDADLAEVCRAQEVVDFISNPYVKLEDTTWVSIMANVSTACGAVAAARAARDIEQIGIAEGQIRATLPALTQRPELRCARGDLFMVCMSGNRPIKETLVIDRVFLDNFRLTFDSGSPDLSGVRFSSCFFDTIEFSGDCVISSLPKFAACAVVRVEGRSSRSDLPATIFDEACDIEQFAGSVATVSSILGLPMPRGQRIVLSLLRKLFVQSLSGRQEGALVRGLDLPDRPFVQQALGLLEHEGFVSSSSRPGESLWLPNRKRLGRVRRMLAAPTNSDEGIMKAAASIT